MVAAKSLIFILIFSFSLQAQFYRQLHNDALVVDMHADALYSYFNSGRSIETFSRRGHVDLVRLKQGGVDVQFFAVWPDPRDKQKPSAYKQAVTILDTLDKILQRNTELIELAPSPQDIKRIVSENKISACIGLEGGSAIEDDLNKLEYFYNRGVRYLGLTWNNSTSWASSSADEVKASWTGLRGLNDFGKQVVRAMNQMGMIIDVSHLGEKAFYDVLQTTTKPIIASHSAVYSICPHHRNLKDKQIEALAENGGVIFINFYAGYLVKDFDNIYQQARKRATAIQDSLYASESPDHFDRNVFIHSAIDSIYPSIKTLVDHIDYVANLVGDEHVGLGSDFDGISLAPAGLEDVSKMPEITEELLERGYSVDSIKKILGGNFMRVFKQVVVEK